VKKVALASASIIGWVALVAEFLKWLTEHWPK